MEVLNIVAGKRYVLRNGLITNVMREIPESGTNYVFETEVKEPQFQTPSVACWLKFGKYLTNTVEHELDIVAEYNSV